MWRRKAASTSNDPLRTADPARGTGSALPEPYPLQMANGKFQMVRKAICHSLFAICLLNFLLGLYTSRRPKDRVCATNHDWGDKRQKTKAPARGGALLLFKLET